MIVFAYPLAFLLLAMPFMMYFLLPPVKGMHGDALRVPFIKDVKRINVLSGQLWSNSQTAGDISKRIFLGAVWFFLCLAAARPQYAGEPVRSSNSGRDIMLVSDISTSMRNADFSYQGRRIDRLTAVKIAADGFINERNSDRIGLILFGTRAYMQSPVTFDKQAVSNILWASDAGMAGNSTAIGDALAMALKNLRANSKKTENKIIILLTDGENNDGSLDMFDVLKLAKEENIKIYTIGVGADEQLNAGFFSIRMPQGGLDEKNLKKLADETKGRYFRAFDTKGLQKIYDEIDRMEPDFDEDKYIQERHDLFYYPLGIAFVLALIILLLQRKTA
ncbi:MAG: VWA domain-containing protein [Alphaproteobacteria bacterium]|nr:VWA domain-containing protein [Alphaproteobacteria bacterium]